MDAEEFKRLRKILGLTQVELARSMRVHPRELQRWESGSVKVPGPVSVLLELWSGEYRQADRAELWRNLISAQGG